MELTEEVKALLLNTAKELKGSALRVFMARTVTPVGILLPASNELFLYGVTSKVTSDCLVDRLVDWWESVKERFAHITTLLINLDNGPESHSRRTEVSCSAW